MGTKNLNSATDLITFSRNSKGTALRKISYGSELVTNGDFATDTSGWQARNSGILSVDSQRLKITNGGNNTGATRQLVSVTPNKTYKVSFSVFAGSVSTTRIFIGTTLGGSDLYTNYGFNATNQKFELFVSSSTGGISITVAVASFTQGDYFFYDNFSIKEVLYDQPDGTLQLYNHLDNTPRIEYNADGTVKGLLIEEARTNLVTTSSGWNTGATNVSFGGYTTAPDGTNTGSLFITDATGNYSTNLGTVTTSSTNQFVTFSVFFKKELARYATFKIAKSAFDGRFWYDFDTGNTNFSTHPSFENRTFSVEDYPNGWKRMSISFSNSSTSGVFNLNVAPSNDEPYATYNRNITGDGTQGVYFWGAQGELASFPTSYIPTTGSTATRAADVASIATSSRKFNSSSGTFVADFSYTDNGNTNINYVLGGSSSARIMYNNAGSNTWNTFDGTTSTSIGAIDGNGATHKIAVSVREGSSTSTCLDGTLTASASSSALMSNTISSTTISIGGGSASQRLNGHIKSIKYYPRRLSNTQLQELTT